jgi:RNA polymerase sigma factor (TIGR02999 family)
VGTGAIEFWYNAGNAIRTWHMAAPTANEITRLLRAWDSGDREALDKLIPVVYGELRRTARQYLALEAPGRTVQPTEVVNEVYLRLADLKGVGWKDRAHFFALCSRMMRRILTDFARSRHARKRGGEAIRVSLEEAMPMSREMNIDWLALDDALNALAQFDERKSRVVELRFFGGLNFEEAAAVLGISTPTVKRDWKTAKVWLLRELRRGKRNGG